MRMLMSLQMLLPDKTPSACGTQERSWLISLNNSRFLGMGRIPWPAGLAKLDWLPFTNILGSGTNKKSLSALSILVSPMSFSFFALKFLFGARVFEKNVCWERQCLTKKKLYGNPRSPCFFVFVSNICRVKREKERQTEKCPATRNKIVQIYSSGRGSYA